MRHTWARRFVRVPPLRAVALNGARRIGSNFLRALCRSADAALASLLRLRACELLREAAALASLLQLPAGAVLRGSGSGGVRFASLLQLPAGAVLRGCRGARCARCAYDSGRAFCCWAAAALATLLRLPAGAVLRGSGRARFTSPSLGGRSAVRVGQRSRRSHDSARAFCCWAAAALASLPRVPADAVLRGGGARFAFTTEGTRSAARQRRRSFRLTTPGGRCSARVRRRSLRLYDSDGRCVAQTGIARAIPSDSCTAGCASLLCSG